MKEAAHHQRAFEAFYAMGQGRSLAALASQLNVSQASVKLWSRTFGWTQRIAERDAALASAVEEKTIHVAVDRRTRNRKIIEAGIVRAARAVANGDVKPSYADLEKFIRLEDQLEAQGGPRDGDLRSKSVEELHAMGKAALRELASLLGETAVLEALDRPKTD